jgi:hypothetical protein
MSKGDPVAAERLYRFLTERRRLPAPPPWPEGITTDPGEDLPRKMQIRIAGVAVARAAARDAAIANVYDIIRWFPETDGKKK